VVSRREAHRRASPNDNRRSMRRASGSIVTASALVMILGAPRAYAAPPRGRVVGVSDGRGVPQAAVTLTLGADPRGPTAITVFTDEEGGFQLPRDFSALPAGATLQTRKLGYRQVPPAAGAMSAARSAGTGSDEVRLYVASSADISGQVPASAWLARMPAGEDKNVTITSCTSCHQLPSPRMREYAAKIETVRGGPEGDKKALEEWRKVVRHEAWRMIVKYMRSMHYAVFPLESPMNLDAIDWTTAQNPDYSFFNARQGEIAASYLADHFPRSTASLSRDAYAYGAPLGVNEHTVIREFAFPERALVRELVAVPHSNYLWGADVRRNRIVRLDPTNGDEKWYPVDFSGSTGPHTIAPDDVGNLWVTMVDHDQFGRFDPRTERWKLWTLRPTELAKSDSMAGAAIVHDLSIDSRGHMARDMDGNIWLTMVGTNQMGTVNPDTGAVAFYDTNTIEGLSPINHLMYGAVLSADGRHAWYSQLNGSVGCIDTASKKREKLIPFPEGTGPRRMTRDNAGHLWVALFGSGQVAKIDMAGGEIVAIFDLPDRSAAPYAVSWDERRHVVWVANANSDAVYRLDPRTGVVLVYPLPRQMTYLRQISVDEESGSLVGSYGNYPEGSGPSMGILIDPGD
jgi:streptogramin lyase